MRNRSTWLAIAAAASLSVPTVGLAQFSPGASPGGAFSVTITELPDVDPQTVEPIQTFTTPFPVVPGFVVLVDQLTTGLPGNPNNPQDWSDIVEFGPNGLNHFFYSDPFDPQLVSRVLATGYFPIPEVVLPTVYSPAPQPGAVYLIFSDLEVPEPASLGLMALPLALLRRRTA